jgi:hypothetical protein
MLSKQRCPHTGVVNFFSATDPFVAIGSIIKAGRTPSEFHWRVYDAVNAVSGIATDMAEAERRIKSQIRQRDSRPS